MKTIYLDKQILLVDETAETYVKNDWILDNLDDNIIHEVEVKSGILMKGEFKIIAASPKLGDLPEFETLPPNICHSCKGEGKIEHAVEDEGKYPCPVCDGSGELPPNTEDDVEKLANEYTTTYNLGWLATAKKEKMEAFIAGYKQAKSETMFSLEDAIKIFAAGRSFEIYQLARQLDDFKESDNPPLNDINYIQSLTKPKQYEFVPEMEIYMGLSNAFGREQLKIVNNKIQGIWKQITHTG